MSNTEKLLDPKNWINPKTGEKYMYFSRQGEGYDDVLDWAKHFEDRKNKVVKQSYLYDKRIFVSTVWLGLDHSFMPTEPPLIFETRVFSSLARWGRDLDMNRYTTEKQALAGHEAIVEKWSNPFYVAKYIIWDEGIYNWWWDFKIRVNRFLKANRA